MKEPQDRRAGILACAAELFARRGVGVTTVREIADAAGLLSGSLYHHFESKDAIVAEILTRYLAAIQDRYAAVLGSGKPPADSLHDLVLASLQVASEQPDATTIYQNERPYLRERERFADVLAGAAGIQRTWLLVIEKGVADGTFRGDIAPRVFYRLIRDAVWLSARWHHPAGDYPTGQLAQDITAVFLHGYATADDRVDVRDGVRHPGHEHRLIRGRVLPVREIGLAVEAEARMAVAREEAHGLARQQGDAVGDVAERERPRAAGEPEAEDDHDARVHPPGGIVPRVERQPEGEVEVVADIAGL